jgi:hypothetical protein
MSEEDLQRVLPVLLQAIKLYSTAFEGLEVVRFSCGHERISTAHVEQFLWPPMESKVTLAQTIFKVAQSSYALVARRKYNEQVDLELERFQRYVSEPPKGRALCTRFTDLAVRIEDENLRWNLLISDGWNDCRDKLKVENQMTGRLVIVLLPRRRERSGQSENTIFEQRKQEMRRLFPTAEIIHPYLLTKSVENMLAVPK